MIRVRRIPTGITIRTLGCELRLQAHIAYSQISTSATLTRGVN